MERLISDRLNSSRPVFRLDLTLGFSETDGLHERYQVLLTVWKTFATTKEFKEVRRTHGMEYVRVLEETYSSKGWFPHFHLLVTFEREENAWDRIDHLIQGWVRAARKLGANAKTGSQGIDRLQKAESASATSWYLSKHGRFDLKFKSKTWQAGDRPVRPLLLLMAAAAQGDLELVAEWNIFERASQGKRRYAWSRGLGHYF